MSKKWLAFDIETLHKAPDNPGDSYALGVTCAATMRSGDDEPRLWAAGPVGADGRYPEKMTPAQVCGFAAYLVECAHDGYSVASINGLGFDFRVLAEECKDLVTFDNLRDLALAHYDPPFQMLAERGFMVGMKALAVGLQLTEQKSADMDGQKAVEMWTGSRADQDKVLEYVAQDARTTLAIIEALENKRWTWEQWDFQRRETVRYENRQAIRWLTKAGKISHHCLEHGLLTVQECLALPLPDTNWMKRRGSEPWARERFTEWTQISKEIYHEANSS